MSLLTALASGTTGLESSSIDLSVVSDNIANSNTVGFKSGRAAFEDALAQTVLGMGHTGEVGLGSRLSTVQKILSQGALTSTGLATDLALQGDGYFVVRGSYNGQQTSFYTRAGQFTVDDAGYLVNLQGLRVQGFQADPTGALSGTVGDLLVGTASAQPSPTSRVTLKANLQADATIPAAWDPTDASDTSNFSSSSTVYDSLGTAHDVQVFYRRTGGGTWEWHAMTDGAGVTGGTAGQLSEIASGQLTFDTQGRLQAVTETSDFDPANAVQDQPLTFDFGDAVSAGGTGLAGVTQFASDSTTTFVGQDGFGSGQLASVSIDAQGFVNGTFTNGQTRVLGQVAVADFPASDQLQRTGGNLYSQTVASGQPVVGVPGSGGRASIVSGSLEQSNVDLSEQFVRMISAQRAFQANSKTITTADALLQELISMKR